MAISMRQCDHRWVIVLAGGSGTRLASITRDRRGSIVPKQYCSLRGDRSLLGHALDRAAAIAVEEQTLVVVAAEHEEYWSREFRGREVEQLVVQPRNRGTAAGVLLPLFAVLQRDPDAVVTLLPSDHFLAEEWTLADALRAAQRAAIAAPSRAILLGVDPDSVETDYGWILPTRARLPGSVAPADAGTLAITAFVEKPDQATAADLWLRGAVWNSFMVVARGTALLALYKHKLPGLLRAFADAHAHAPRGWRALYERIATNDFSRDVLQGSVRHLGLRIVPPCGWTDLGTPDRVARCLATVAASPGHAESVARPASCAVNLGEGLDLLDRTPSR